jgi:uncharacterized protein with HEPN domain
MEIEIRKYLYDIQQACQLIGEFTDGQTFERYQSDSLLKSAVERQFIDGCHAAGALRAAGTMF